MRVGPPTSGASDEIINCTGLEMLLCFAVFPVRVGAKGADCILPSPAFSGSLSKSIPLSDKESQFGSFSSQLNGAFSVDGM